MFVRYDLRTTDPDAARRFYADVVGLDFAADKDSGLAVWELHEQARARGAPPHWLGALAVDDLATRLRHLLEAGSERLGPAYAANDGATSANLRDPSGAVVAVRQGGRASRAVPVAWHQLHTRDADATPTGSSIFRYRTSARLSRERRQAARALRASPSCFRTERAWYRAMTRRVPRSGSTRSGPKRDSTSLR